MIVVDASVVVELVLRSPAAEQVADSLFPEAGRWHVPHLLDAEVAHVLRRYAHLGALSDTRGAMALELLTALPMTRHEAVPLLPRVWALRQTVTAYDALYVALAELLGATLYTRDLRLARAVERLVAVRVVEGGAVAKPRQGARSFAHTEGAAEHQASSCPTPAPRANIGRSILSLRLSPRHDHATRTA